MQEERVPDRGVRLGLEGLKSRGWRRTPSIKNGPALSSLRRPKERTASTIQTGERSLTAQPS